MSDLRTVAWELLIPFTREEEGLPPDAEWTSVTRIPRPPGTATPPAELIKTDAARAAEPERPLLHEAVFLNSKAWKFMESLPTTAEMKARFVREVELPPESMAIKMFFYRIRGDQEVRVRLWDWTKIKVRNLTDLDPSDLASQCVKLEASPEGCIAARPHFYTVRINETNKPLFTCGENPCGLEEGDLLILVGMHVASKQTPEWLWATFWWRGPDQERLSGTYWTCQDAQRPSSIAAVEPWKNYSMDTTASLQLLKPRPDPRTDEALCGYPPTLGDQLHVDPADQGYLATYNPFAEANFPNGLKANCVNCHARASTTATRDAKVPVFHDIYSPSLSDLEGTIRLDYLWSLRRRLDRTFWPPRG